MRAAVLGALAAVVAGQAVTYTNISADGVPISGNVSLNAWVYYRFTYASSTPGYVVRLGCMTGSDDPDLYMTKTAFASYGSTTGTVSSSSGAGTLDQLTVGGPYATLAPITVGSSLYIGVKGYRASGYYLSITALGASVTPSPLSSAPATPSPPPTPTATVSAAASAAATPLASFAPPVVSAAPTAGAIAAIDFSTVVQSSLAYRLTSTYAFTMPADVASSRATITITLTAITGDPDLRIGTVAPNANGTFNFNATASNGGSDTYTLAPTNALYPPAAGSVLYLQVYAYSSCTYTLRMSVTVSPTSSPVAGFYTGALYSNGGARTGTTTPNYPLYFSFLTPSAGVSYEVTVSAYVTGNVFTTTQNVALAIAPGGVANCRLCAFSAPSYYTASLALSTPATQATSVVTLNADSPIANTLWTIRLDTPGATASISYAVSVRPYSPPPTPSPSPTPNPFGSMPVIAAASANGSTTDAGVVYNVTFPTNGSPTVTRYYKFTARVFSGGVSAGLYGRYEFAVTPVGGDVDLSYGYVPGCISSCTYSSIASSAYGGLTIDRVYVDIYTTNEWTSYAIAVKQYSSAATGAQLSIRRVSAGDGNDPNIPKPVPTKTIIIAVLVPVGVLFLAFSLGIFFCCPRSCRCCCCCQARADKLDRAAQQQQATIYERRAAAAAAATGRPTVTHGPNGGVELALNNNMPVTLVTTTTTTAYPPVAAPGFYPAPVVPTATVQRGGGGGLGGYGYFFTSSGRAMLPGTGRPTQQPPAPVYVNGGMSMGGASAPPGGNMVSPDIGDPIARQNSTFGATAPGADAGPRFQSGGDDPTSGDDPANYKSMRGAGGAAAMPMVPGMSYPPVPLPVAGYGYGAPVMMTTAAPVQVTSTAAPVSAATIAAAAAAAASVPGGASVVVLTSAGGDEDPEPSSVHGSPPPAFVPRSVAL